MTQGATQDNKIGFNGNQGRIQQISRSFGQSEKGDPYVARAAERAEGKLRIRLIQLNERRHQLHGS